MKRSATAVWTGSLKDGKGNLTTPAGALKSTPYSFASRFESGDGTNPEELIAAAHAGCFSMALASMLSEVEHVPDLVSTTAKVTIETVDGAPTITRSELSTEVTADGLED